MCFGSGTDEAPLAEAKRNVMQHYSVVGLTEDLTSFFTVLEATFPRIFDSAKKTYKGISHL